MPYHPEIGLIERLAIRWGFLPDTRQETAEGDYTTRREDGTLVNFPPMDKWDDWVEYDAKAWPKKRVPRHYSLVPTICFNCEAACGLLAYIDKETQSIRKFEGNPLHPGSRGRNCAKGPATINQVTDPERILYPLKRKGPRGSGQWERVTWNQVLDDIGGRIRKALQEGRQNEVMYHVGRPGHERYMDRVLQAWGVDGHNSHTNICSSGARMGYQIWQGYDRPSPDHANARFILLLSAHLEAGHYFNPHAQRIIDGKMAGAKIAVLDPRLSNTASMADYWLPTQPGSEAAVLLAMAKVILTENLYDHEFLRRWVNWEEYLKADWPNLEPTFDNFIAALQQVYTEFTPEFAARESGVDAALIVEVARQAGRAGSRLATHNWRGAGSGNLGGWQVARALHLLNVLTGSVGTPGGTSPNAWNKYQPQFWENPPAQKFWNELSFPLEYPFGCYEMSFLLPHFLKEGRGRLEVYFTRVYNPVWTNPDGFTWMEVLRDETKVGLHIALTPTWSETAFFADYVLPTGHSPERHDLQSQETHAGVWLSFRQPVLREYLRRQGKEVEFTYQANPGEVWEEDEFWIELSWRIDPDSSLGIRRHFESPYRSGEKLKSEEYYRWIFENAVPGLPEKAAQEGLSPLDYMRRYGAFQIPRDTYQRHERRLGPQELAGSETDPQTSTISKDGKAIGVMIDGVAVEGFASPSRKQEFYSSTLVAWEWPEYRTPGYIKSHVHPENLDLSKGEMVLVPTFRLPTLIHTRSGNAKWLTEISHRNPVWMHPSDARRLGVQTGDLLRVTTDIGYFVNHVWVTESIKPGVVACSHHLGRWRRPQDQGSRWSTGVVNIEEDNGRWRLRQVQGISPFPSTDPDSSRIWWSDSGVHQNLTFPVHPDPLSGMHCWHQKVRVEKAYSADRYGDVVVDTAKSHAIYKEWLAKTRPAPGPDGLRRPLWFTRPVRPAPEMFFVRNPRHES
ncbi:MAG TPA: molybdopterin-dependent oxidoreductase [Candidatus Binatia bacterium]|nr:molybdopterin-dependent oxidoreductase [Candidatus Binatia bacterium]